MAPKKGKRKSPVAKASSLALGTVRRGRDGRAWKVARAGQGSRRRKLWRRTTQRPDIAIRRRGPRISKRPRILVCGGSVCRVATKAHLKRPSPVASATGFPVGTVRMGKYGRPWRVIRSGGTKRWSKISQN